VITMSFAAPIAPPAGAPPPSNALFGYIDLDLDADAATGEISNVEQYGPMGAGTELGIEAFLEIPDWDAVSQTISFHPFVGADTRVPIVFRTNGLTVTVPLAPGFAPSVHVGAAIGNVSDPTDVAPNTMVSDVRPAVSMMRASASFDSNSTMRDSMNPCRSLAASYSAFSLKSP